MPSPATEEFRSGRFSTPGTRAMSPTLSLMPWGASYRAYPPPMFSQGRASPLLMPSWARASSTRAWAAFRSRLFFKERSIRVSSWGSWKVFHQAARVPSSMAASGVGRS